LASFAEVTSRDELGPLVPPVPQSQSAGGHGGQWTTSPEAGDPRPGCGLVRRTTAVRVRFGTSPSQVAAPATSRS
jgi:hypothetical protein